MSACSDEFIADLLISQHGEPEWGEIADSVYRDHYSRSLVEEDGSERKERWGDTVARVVRGNTEGFVLESGEYDWLLENIYNLRMVPAGRHLWSTGAASGVKATANCFVAPWDDARLAKHFTWTFDHLLIGGGVGANYSAEVRSTAKVYQVPRMAFVASPDHADIGELEEEGVMYSWTAPDAFRIEDSREGWVEALRVLMSASQFGSHKALVFDVSDVRPFGAPIRGFGGTASGPAPLVRMLNWIRDILVQAEGRRLSALESMRIDHCIAACVVAGNVRRSARMSILMWDDPEVWDFIDCKSKGVGHWSTNISVGIDQAFLDAVAEGQVHALAVHQEVVKGMLHNGEPGYCNLGLINDHKPRHEWTMWCTNPCSEATLEEGEACVLSQVNLAAFATAEEGELLEAFKMCARFALRATARTYLDDLEQEVSERNRRIGVGFMGLQDYAVANGVKYSDIPDSSKIEEMLLAAYESTRSAATEMAEGLGWNVPVSFTAVAPTGTISMLAGCSSGCEPVPFPYYWRAVRHAKGSSEAWTAEHVYGLMTEDCIYSRDTTVVYHPGVAPTVSRATDPDLVEGAMDVRPVDHMRVLAFVQDRFSDQSVSKTINLPVKGKTDEGKFSADILRYLPLLKGVTAFPATSMPQAPYTEASVEEVGSGANMAATETECVGASCPIR